MPDTLVINVRESAEMAVLHCGESYWLLDNRCKILAEVNPPQEGRAEVLGLEALEPTVGSLRGAGRKAGEPPGPAGRHSGAGYDREPDQLH